MPSSLFTGRITAITSKPNKGFTISDGRSPGVTLTFESGIDSDDWTLIVAAYNSGKTATVEYTPGTPPTFIGIRQP